MAVKMRREVGCGASEYHTALLWHARTVSFGANTKGSSRSLEKQGYFCSGGAKGRPAEAKQLGYKHAAGTYLATSSIEKYTSTVIKVKISANGQLSTNVARTKGITMANSSSCNMSDWDQGKGKGVSTSFLWC